MGATRAHTGCPFPSLLRTPWSSSCPGRQGCDLLGNKLAGPCSGQQPCCTVPQFPFLTGKYASTHPQPSP